MTFPRRSIVFALIWFTTLHSVSAIVLADDIATIDLLVEDAKKVVPQVPQSLQRKTEDDVRLIVARSLAFQGKIDDALAKQAEFTSSNTKRRMVFAVATIHAARSGEVIKELSQADNVSQQHVYRVAAKWQAEAGSFKLAFEYLRKAQPVIGGSPKTEITPHICLISKWALDAKGRTAKDIVQLGSMIIDQLEKNQSAHASDWKDFADEADVYVQLARKCKQGGDEKLAERFHQLVTSREKSFDQSKDPRDEFWAIRIRPIFALIHEQRGEKEQSLQQLQKTFARLKQVYDALESSEKKLAFIEDAGTRRVIRAHVLLRDEKGQIQVQDWAQSMLKALRVTNVEASRVDAAAIKLASAEIVALDELHDANRLAKAMTRLNDDFAKVSVLNELYDAATSRGETTRALEHVRSAVRLYEATTDKDKLVKSELAGIMSRNYRLLGENEKSDAIIAKAVKLQESEPNRLQPTNDDAGYRSLAIRHLAKRHYAEARETMLQIKDPIERLIVLKEIVNSLLDLEK